MVADPYQKYKNTQYETASREKLLIMLYEGAIKFSNQAKNSIAEEDFQQSNNKLQRVQAIINELSATLNHEKGGEIADNLDSLYEYINRRLIQANIRKDEDIIDEVIGYLLELKEAFEAAAKKVNNNKVNQSGELNIEG